MDRSPASRVRAASSALLADGEVDRVAEFFTEDYLAHVTGQDLAGGHGLLREVVATYRRAFPDLTVEVEVLAESGDRIAWRRAFQGTQHGSYRGFPATGKRVTWSDLAVSRFIDGRIAEEWIVTDLAERLLLARKG